MGSGLNRICAWGSPHSFMVLGITGVADDGKRRGWRGCWGSCRHGHTLCIKRFRHYYAGCGVSDPDPLL